MSEFTNLINKTNSSVFVVPFLSTKIVGKVVVVLVVTKNDEDDKKENVNEEEIDRKERGRKGGGGEGRVRGLPK